LDLDELAVEDRKLTKYSALDGDEMVEVVDTDREALVPSSCADRTFAVGEVMDVVAYAVDIGPREKSYLSGAQWS
jgi:hypothetical protein